MLRLMAILLSVVILGNNPMSLQIQNEIPRPSPLIVELPSFTVIGPFVRTANAIEMSGQGGKIGPLWNHFMHGGLEAIPGVIDRQTVYAVYTNYESDERGAYDLILGQSVHPEQQVPANMKILHVPAARYITFAASGSSPDAIRTAWSEVYRYFAQRPNPQRAFTYDFEQHSSKVIKIFIAIK